MKESLMVIISLCLAIGFVLGWISRTYNYNKEEDTVKRTYTNLEVKA